MKFHNIGECIDYHIDKSSKSILEISKDTGIDVLDIIKFRHCQLVPSISEIQLIAQSLGIEIELLLLYNRLEYKSYPSDAYRFLDLINALECQKEIRLVSTTRKII